MEHDPFPSSEFDQWAGSYDHSTQTDNIFPFDGYDRVLETVIGQVQPRPGMSILDLGTGTANLAIPLAGRGAEIWATDFSEKMLEIARQKLPAGKFFLHDLRQPLPAELSHPFDAIVSAYVFHHFELGKKVSICLDLAENYLAPGGKLVIADLSFPNRAAMDAFAVSIGELWEEEFYWLVDETLPALEQAGLKVNYQQVSACAGVYVIRS